MKLRYKSFRLCTDILKFVEDNKIDADNVISISSIKGHPTIWHYLWWKEEEKQHMVSMPGTIKGEYSLDEIEGQHINLSDGKSHTICCLVDEIRRLTK